ncbi:MAG: NAD-dependent epimerase/dehydratase [Rhizobium sp.]|nr:NAD-dependent epimerase/dehydratase [Rhizobium sp.]
MNAPDHVSFPVNIGNPNEFTIRELAEMVMAKIPSTSRLIYLPLPQDDPMQRCPDISRAREHLGWEPKIFLGDGLDAAIEYFGNRIGVRTMPGFVKTALRA